MYAILRVVAIPLLWLSVCMAIKSIYEKNKLFSIIFIVLLLFSACVSLDFRYDINNKNQIVVTHINHDYRLISADDLVIDGELSSTGLRELIKHHPDNNTYIEELSVYWKPHFKRAYISQHDTTIFEENFAKRVKDTLTTA
ncbi:MAG: hypothetical protein LBV42_02560 [Methanobrevibacter sp.]|jgi:hypothetical protein|nr:hypothetical protein [Methanobrevibacter sp.]